MKPLFKFFIVVKVCLSLLLVQSALLYSRPVAALQINDPAYWNMNSALSGVTQQALKSRGYMPTDPRTYGTLQAMSKAAADIAGGTAATATAVALGTVTAPTWGSLLLVAAASYAIGALVQLGVSSLVSWLFRSDNKVDVSSDTLPYPSCTLGTAFEYWYASLNGLTIYSCDGTALALQVLNTRYPASQGQSQQTSCVNSVTVIGCSNANGSAYAFRSAGTTSVSCGPGTYLSGTSCLPYTYPLQPAVAPATAQTLQQAVNAVPASDLSKPLNPQLVAMTANTLWQTAASQPGYSGFPYPASNPITTQEAQTWQQANPSLWPTVGNFTSPTPTNTTPSSYGLPLNPAAPATTSTTSTNNNVTNPASANPLQNLGPDPAIPAPTLENIPTAQSILAPILNLFSDLKAYQSPLGVGVCPRGTFSLWGNTYTLEAHCTLMDNNAPVLRGAAVAGFMLAALFIILSA